MILSDFHVHTNFCDGTNNPEDIVVEAVARGMKKLGFSGHSYTSFDEGYCMSLEGTKKYIAEIHRLQEKYKNLIKIFLGTECDYYSDININDYDYIIGSVHYVKVNDIYCHVDNTPEMFESAINDCFDGDVYSFIEKYYLNVSDVVNKTNCNIIGHFDLITKFNADNRFFDENNPRYINAVNHALEKLIHSGAVFEINTGAIFKGYKKSAYPSLRILKYLAENHGKIILSSDSHKKESLMYKFDEYEKLALSLGLEIVEL